MALRGEYSIEMIISAFITFAVIMLILRIYLKRIARKRPSIQRPDWLKERKPRKEHRIDRK